MHSSSSHDTDSEDSSSADCATNTSCQLFEVIPDDDVRSALSQRRTGRSRAHSVEQLDPVDCPGAVQQQVLREWFENQEALLKEPIGLLLDMFHEKRTRALHSCLQRSNVRETPRRDCSLRGDNNWLLGALDSFNMTVRAVGLRPRHYQRGCHTALKSHADGVDVGSVVWSDRSSCLPFVWSVRCLASGGRQLCYQRSRLRSAGGRLRSSEPALALLAVGAGWIFVGRGGPGYGRYPHRY
jgi:hypothetical protein